jgi:hypothetical protein
MRDDKVGGLVIEKVFPKRGTFENRKKLWPEKKGPMKFFFSRAIFFSAKLFFHF